MRRERNDAPWYEDGLQFSCTRCGHCCTIPGYVWVTEPEIERIAAHLELDVAAFMRRYARRVDRRWSLTEKNDDACVFWEDGCTVYEARPTQCRTFPFWKENIRNPQKWADVVVECPGSGEGRLYSIGEIRRLATGQGEAEATPGAAPRSSASGANS